MAADVAGYVVTRIYAKKHTEIRAGRLQLSLVTRIHPQLQFCSLT